VLLAICSLSLSYCRPTTIPADATVPVYTVHRRTVRNTEMGDITGTCEPCLRLMRTEKSSVYCTVRSPKNSGLPHDQVLPACFPMYCTFSVSTVCTVQYITVHKYQKTLLIEKILYRVRQSTLLFREIMSLLIHISGWFTLPVDVVIVQLLMSGCMKKGTVVLHHIFKLISFQSFSNRKYKFLTQSMHFSEIVWFSNSQYTVNCFHF